MKPTGLTLIILTTVLIPSKSDLVTRNSLRGNSLRQDNEGDYNLRIKRKVDNQRILKSLPKVTVAVEGDVATLPCQFENVTNGSYIWFDVIGRKLQQTDYDRISVDNEGNLIIKDVERTDEGIYECLAVSDNGSVRRKIRLVVQTPPSVMLFDSVVATEGMVIEMECISQGEPILSINFQRNGSDIVAVNKQMSMTQKVVGTTVIAKLIIRDVKRGYAGMYTCRATNKYGSDERIARLTVHYPPLVSTEIKQVPAYPGLSVNLTCMVDAEPPARFTWEFQGRVLTGNGTYINMSEHHCMSILTISPRNASDFGTYKCLASNGVSAIAGNDSLNENNTWVEIQLQFRLDKRARKISENCSTPCRNVSPAVGDSSEEYPTSSQNMAPAIDPVGISYSDTSVRVLSGIVCSLVLVILGLCCIMIFRGHVNFLRCPLLKASDTNDTDGYRHRKMGKHSNVQNDFPNGKTEVKDSSEEVTESTPMRGNNEDIRNGS